MKLRFLDKENSLMILVVAVSIGLALFFFLRTRNIWVTPKCYSLDSSSNEAFAQGLQLSAEIEKIFSNSTSESDRNLLELFSLTRAKLLAPALEKQSDKIYMTIRDFYDQGDAILMRLPPAKSINLKKQWDLHKKGIVFSSACL